MCGATGIDSWDKRKGEKKKKMGGADVERWGEQDTDIGGVLTPGDDQFFGAVAGASAVVRLGKYCPVLSCPVLMCVYYLVTLAD